MTTAISKIAKVVDRKANEQPKSATIVRVDHGFVDISLGPGSGVIHHVLVQGNIDQLAPNMTVPIQWEERQGGYLYPVVIATGGELATVGSVPLVLVDNVTLRTVDGELSVKPGGIGLSQLGFVPSIDGHSHPSELAQAGLQVQTGVLQNVNQDLNITGEGRIEAGGDLFIDGADPTYRLWVGDEDPALAPFSIEADGTVNGIGGSVTVEETDGSPSVEVTKIKVSPGTLTDNGNGEVTIQTAGASTLTVEEADGNPSVANVSKIKVPNGSLTDNGSGVVAVITQDGDAIHENASGEINAITEKTAVVGNDILLGEDSEASYAKVKMKVDNIVSPYVRERLTADRTYYVDDGGSDSNDGLSVGTAFQTIQKAVDTIAALDINGYIATVQVTSGTYTDPVTLKNVIGYTSPGCLVIQGLESNMYAVVVSTTNANAFNAESVSCAWDIKWLKIQTTTSGNCIRSFYGSTIRISGVVFGSCAGYHMTAGGSSAIFIIGNYNVFGGASAHLYAWGAQVVCQGKTIYFGANCTFTDFAYVQIGGRLVVNSNTYNLQGYTVTGRRYYAISNGVIFTSGGGANYFPGNTAGATATGGQYV